MGNSSENVSNNSALKGLLLILLFLLMIRTFDRLSELEESVTDVIGYSLYSLEYTIENQQGIIDELNTEVRELRQELEYIHSTVSDIAEHLNVYR